MIMTSLLPTEIEVHGRVGEYLVTDAVVRVVLVDDLLPSCVE